MAVINAGITNQGSAESIKLATWAPLANGDSGSPMKHTDWADRCVQVFGTFGAGGTVVLEGSNEAAPTTWATLNDTSGTAISLTAAGIRQMNEAPLWVRPRVTAGDGSTSLTVALVARRLYQTNI